MSQVWPWSIALDFWLKTRQILLKDPTIANLMKFLEWCDAGLGGQNILKFKRYHTSLIAPTKY